MEQVRSPAGAARDRRADIDRAVQILRAGGVIAMPTDTVYGIAASLDHPDAIERLFSIKGRSGTKAIPILLSRAEDLERVAPDAGEPAARLARHLWPGALTIVVAASDAVPQAVRRGGHTVGVRVPDSAIACEIIAGAGGALAVTSANRSGDAEARSADEVRMQLGRRVDFVVDGGASPANRPSTVVDVTVEPVRILRLGAIEPERVREVLERTAAP